MSSDCRDPRKVAKALSRKVMVGKAHRSTLDLLILGVLAGVYIGFGAQLATMVTRDAAAFVGVGLSKMIGGAVFSVGLMFVLLAGAELFTGNTLMALAVLDRQIRVRDLLRNWIIVYVANLAGALLLVLLVSWSGLAHAGDGATGAAAMRIANAKIELTFLEALARGILCNWLVCLAIWMATAARTVAGKILAILFPIMAFVASGYEHSVANMFFLPMGWILKGQGVAGASATLTWPGIVLRNLLPVTLGNILGGSFFVGTLYAWTYLRPEKTSDA